MTKRKLFSTSLTFAKSIGQQIPDLHSFKNITHDGTSEKEQETKNVVECYIDFASVHGSKKPFENGECSIRDYV